MQGQTVGQLSIDKNEQYYFEYHQNWVDTQFSISPHLPFHAKLSSVSIKRFLENLIPEGGRG